MFSLQMVGVVTVRIRRSVHQVFGIGIRLDQPGEIKQIPLILQKHQPDAAVLAKCWIPIEKERFQVLLGIGQKESSYIANQG